MDKMTPPSLPPTIVITPGGPTTSDKVQRVPPGHVVKQNPDGSFSVVPSPLEPPTDSAPSKESQE